MKLAAKELRRLSPSIEDRATIKRNPIFIILDNVLDTYNIGSIFRLADAVAAEKVILCGDTPQPPNPRIKKASVNTWQWLNWEHAPTAVEAINKLKIPNSFGSQNPASAGPRLGGGLKVIAVEQHPKSVVYTKAVYQFPLAVVVGNETLGVSREVVEIVDEIVEIPMWGVNKSLNVMVSSAIVLYEVMKRLKK